MDLKGAVAIVTGSATGVGREVAKELAAKGCRVVITYSKSEREAKQTAADCQSLGAETMLCQVDVSKDADCRRLAQTTLDQWGRIDILVNSAGTTRYISHRDLEALSGEDFLNMYAVNVVGTYQMIRACEPSMKSQGKGTVVNVSSLAGITGAGSSIAYVASKGALNTMTKALARSLAPEIRVNAVCPGLIQTRWMPDGAGEEKYQAAKKHIEANSPLQAVCTAEEVAEVILWLITGGVQVTGETIRIDAGQHLGFG